MPGGAGHVGQAIRRHLEPLGWRFTILSRSATAANGHVYWDGRTLGDWAREVDGADIVLNLAGRSVNCRYNRRNLEEMRASRVDSTRVIGEAIAQSKRPPRLWLQASTATIYAHRFDAPNDDLTGILGGNEPRAPFKWRASIEIAKAWEAELDRASTPHTRKVALRSAMTMSVDRGSVFDVLANLARRGLGGAAGNGRQFVSWIHESDFCRALAFIQEREDLDGAINVCSPNPLPNCEFMRELRNAVGAKFALPTPAFVLELGALLIGTETELLLKSRRVTPGRLLQSGFQFEFPHWRDAVAELVARQQV